VSSTRGWVLLDTAFGAIPIFLLDSFLSNIEMPEAGRQIIDGRVVHSMLPVYGRALKRRLLKHVDVSGQPNRANADHKPV
jgi:hypothetical protein